MKNINSPKDNSTVMAASSKNIEQSEVPANVWQIEALAEKIDDLSKSQDELKQLIIAQASLQDIGRPKMPMLTM